MALTLLALSFWHLGFVFASSGSAYHIDSFLHRALVISCSASPFFPRYSSYEESPFSFVLFGGILFASMRSLVLPFSFPRDLMFIACLRPQSPIFPTRPPVLKHSTSPVDRD